MSVVALAALAAMVTSLSACMHGGESCCRNIRTVASGSREPLVTSKLHVTVPHVAERDARKSTLCHSWPPCWRTVDEWHSEVGGGNIV